RRSHPARLGSVTAVEGHLPATGLCRRKVHLHPQAAQHLHHALPHLGEERVGQAGDEERDLHRRASLATTGLRSTPIPSMSASMTSPGCSRKGGLQAMPTPGGVPVKMTSPGSKADSRDKNSMRTGTPKIGWLVLESCRVSPLRRSCSRRWWGSGISSAVT